MIVHGIEFPFTEDGLLVNPNNYPGLKERSALDTQWETALQWSASVYGLIHDAINLINMGAAKLLQLEDAISYWNHLPVDGYDHLATYSSLLRIWIAEGWVIIPLDVAWLMEAAYRGMYSIEPEKPAKKEKVVLPKNAGYLYLIQSITGHYKIGKAKDPSDRVATFEVKLPFEIELLHTIECANYHESEKALKLRFIDKRVNGEWFALASEDVAEIKAIQSM